MRFPQTFLLISAFIASFAAVAPVTSAQSDVPVSDPAIQPTTADRFFRGEVIEILKEEDANVDLPNAAAFSQVVKVKILESEFEGREVEIEYGGLKRTQRLEKGDSVVVIEAGGRAEDVFYIFDKYRLTSLYIIIGFFFFMAVVFARWRGFTSLLGLGVSILVLVWYIVPQLMAGKNVLVVVLTGALAISMVSIYLAHGFNRRTTVALGSTLITVCIAMALSFLFVWVSKLMGLGSEEAFYLQTMPIQDINLRGLLLGGIIIGTLGVLDDITTAQAAAVDEIAKANPKLGWRELMRRGASVGREHITSLVNTLVLAYVGASLPALLLFTAYERPFWVVMNTEVIAEEIVRTLVGSIALICAVPITTALAAHFLPKHSSVQRDSNDHVGHYH